MVLQNIKEQAINRMTNLAVIGMLSAAKIFVILNTVRGIIRGYAYDMSLGGLLEQGGLRCPTTEVEVAYEKRNVAA